MITLQNIFLNDIINKDEGKDYFISAFMIETFIELGILLMNILGPTK